MARAETTRSKIEKVNATIAGLLTEMRETHDTSEFIDWGDLINRLKMYRSDLEDDLVKEENELSTIEPLPEAFAQPDTDSEPTLADTTPPAWTNDWDSRKEKQYMDDPEAWSRDEFDKPRLPLIDDDDDDFIDEPDDNEFLHDEDEDEIV